MMVDITNTMEHDEALIILFPDNHVISGVIITMMTAPIYLIVCQSTYSFPIFLDDGTNIPHCKPINIFISYFQGMFLILLPYYNVGGLDMLA